MNTLLPIQQAPGGAAVVAVVGDDGLVDLVRVSQEDLAPSSRLSLRPGGLSFLLLPL